MTKLFPAALLLAALLGLSQCRKNNPNPVDQPPPATQTGANTFGGLVNGQAWTPQGNEGSSNYSVSYDPTYHLGTLSVAAYRLSGNGADQQTLGFSSESVRANGVYFIKKGGRHQAGVVNSATSCQYYSQDAGVYCRDILPLRAWTSQRASSPAHSPSRSTSPAVIQCASRKAASTGDFNHSKKYAVLLQSARTA